MQVTVQAVYVLIVFVDPLLDALDAAFDAVDGVALEFHGKFVVVDIQLRLDDLGGGFVQMLQLQELEEQRLDGVLVRLPGVHSLFDGVQVKLLLIHPAFPLS